jgi:hypothetical protein
MNIPSKKNMTSALIAPSASGTEICPLISTATAPPSMICHILKLNLPTWRTAVSRNTAARTMIGMYVERFF